MGAFYRSTIRALGISLPVAHRIGRYGPFLLDSEFAFSDFENWGRGHNRGFERCVEACRGKRCVLDVGAHLGLVTLPMSRVIAEGGQVHSFEPAVANASHLRAHIAANNIGNVTVVEALVGNDEQTSVRFYEQCRASGQNSVVIKRNRTSYVETWRPQVTLDVYCQSHNLAPDVIKIDVEGSEIAVLQGAREILAKHRPLIFLSVHPVELALLGHVAEDLLPLIDDVGYRCCDVDDNFVQTFHLDEYVLIPKER